MERIALLADIHGNSTALKAVLKDCRQNHIQKFILLGDLFTKGPDPAGVFRQLQRLPTLAAVAGNTDDWLLAAGGLTARQAALTAFTRKELPEPALDVYKRQHGIRGGFPHINQNLGLLNDKLGFSGLIHRHHGLASGRGLKSNPETVRKIFPQLYICLLYTSAAVTKSQGLMHLWN